MARRAGAGAAPGGPRLAPACLDAPCASCALHVARASGEMVSVSQRCIPIQMSADEDASRSVSAWWGRSMRAFGRRGAEAARGGCPRAGRVTET
jgi:hypothetical protein